MALHALINPDTLEDLGDRYDFDGFPQDLSHKTIPLKWIPVVVSPDPVFDPATQKLQRAADVITLTELTESREVVALTAQEQADYADRQDRATKRAGIEARVAWLRSRATVAGSTVADAGNAVSVVNTVLDDLSQFLDGMADVIEGSYLDK